LNLTLNHRLQLADALAWSAAFVEQNAIGKQPRAVARDVALKPNDGLPPNCSSAVEDNGHSLQYARTGVRIH